MKVSSFTLKCIAFLSLICYCVAYSGLIGEQYIKIRFLLSLLGMISMPIIAFLIDEAYRRTGNINKLMIRTFIIALISAFPYRYAFISEADMGISVVQSFFSGALTSFCCLGLILFYDKMKTRTQRAFCVAFICALSMLIGMELAPYALILTAIIHIARDKKFSEMAYYIVSFLAVISLVSIILLFTSKSMEFTGELMRNITLFGGIFALPFIKKYDGTKGPSNKFVTMVSYGFYPTLLIIISVVKFLL